MHIRLLSKRRPMRPDVGLGHCIKLLVILWILAGACLVSAAESSLEAILTGRLPVPGWKPEGQPYRYVPENLYEYINGGADYFIAYGFVALTGANYAPVSGGMDSVTVDIYDMGDKLNAFGVFQPRRDSRAPSLNIGTGSFGYGDYVAFHKDRYYVEIQAYITGKKEKRVVKDMASMVAAHLPGDDSLPHELSYFPEKSRIAGSERYIRGGILGHAFLDRGMVCDYRMEGKKVTAFVAFLSSDREAVMAVDHHRFFLEKSEKKCLPLEGFGMHSFVSEEPYHKTIIVKQAGAFVAGVYDLTSVEAGKTLLTGILRNIAP
ncbi:MAG: hypothetical protein JRC58_01600 [Deltaproteobacteria bacterium]|nr:hypothetical protein [Deltaproteobacteria bacterium]